ncbi:FGGY-family carbohydrate kinase [Enterovibrio calviensis]|uniref:FGGY-family carbohydrate kinase n=1 Tax=Enterovibrio calviensis TaxID=91359 RepID=UPI000487E832|nr:FGGY-family carbohydrate kinase [Enterovibrio calviensis]
MTESSHTSQYVLGIDVGTGSARAGVFSTDGKLIGTDKCDIQIFKDEGNIVEQSSNDIWQAVVRAVRGAVLQAGIAAEHVVGIGVDATCSLVVLGENGNPLPVGDPMQPDRNIIVWMDHRAIEQAERINDIGHRVLDYVGGRISPEMETPKLLWLKEHRPDVFDSAWQFMDLTDFLTWRATNDLARSVCTLTCKWTYLAHENAWDKSYFEAIGLNALSDQGFTRIGTKVVPAGTPLGTGLTTLAAKELGLVEGTPVAAGLIDAHAGGIGSIGVANGGGATANLAYVFGTSSCTMTSTQEPVFVPGVWGPYYSAMVPALWLNEGGQSAAGAAIDALLDLHPYKSAAEQEALQNGQPLVEWLILQAEQLLDGDPNAATLAQGLHVVPEFLGNRAPYADPHTRAVIAGLSMESGLQSLIALYVAGLCGIGYGLRQIIEAQDNAGAKVDRIVISGGAGKSAFVRQLLADTTRREVTAPSTEEPVLLGSAILGSVAGGYHDDIQTAMAKMSHFTAQFTPQVGEIETTHQRRFETYNVLQAAARKSTNF